MLRRLQIIAVQKLTANRPKGPFTLRTNTSLSTKQVRGARAGDSWVLKVTWDIGPIFYCYCRSRLQYIRKQLIFMGDSFLKKKKQPQNI